MAEDSANPLTPMENGTNADQRNDHDHAIAEGNAQTGAPVAADGSTQPGGNAPADGNGQYNGYAPSNGGAQPMGYAPANGYVAPQPNGGIPTNGYMGSRSYTPAQPTQSMPYTQPAQPMQPVQPVQPVQSGPFLSQQPTMQSQQPTTQSRRSGDKPQMDASKILQYVTLGISIVALILGIVANVHVVKPYRIASVAASKPTGSADSEKDSDAKNSAKDQKDSDSKAKSESGSTDGDSSKDFSGAGIKGKYVGTVNGEEMYELDLPGRRSGGSNNKGYTVSADSKLKGDYKLGDHKMHLEITNFEADDTSATLTTEVTNNGTSEGIAGFGASLSQNDEAVDIGAIGSASKTIEPGHKETFTTKFRINDPSQPITITVHLTGEKMIATFTPRS